MEKEIKIGSIGAGQVFERFRQGVEEANQHGCRLKISALADVSFSEAYANIPQFVIEPDWAKNPDPDQAPPVVEMFFNNVDAVYIASPNNMHAGYIRNALIKGKHVLCTKPLTESYTTASELSDSLKKEFPAVSFQPGQLGQPFFMYEDHYLYNSISITLFNKNNGILKKMVGDLGKPLFVEAAFIEKAGASRTEPERIRWLFNPDISGGGVWIDTGIHIIRLLHQLGAEIKVEQAFYELAPGSKAERKIVVNTRLGVMNQKKKKSDISWEQTPCRILVEKDAQSSRKEINFYFEQGFLALNFGEAKILREYQGQVSTIYMPSNPYRNIASVFYKLCTSDNDACNDERLAGLSDAVLDMKVVKEVYQKAGL